MTVLKSKRKESNFEVFNHSKKMKHEIVKLLKREFGFSQTKFEAELRKEFGGRSFDELSKQDQEIYNRTKEKWLKFYKQFIEKERDKILDCISNLQNEINFANTIYPTSDDGLTKRRLHQEAAIGWCNNLLNQLQFAVDELPVNVNSYMRIAEMIDRQIALLKKWRKSDNGFKKTWAVADSAANFANVNSNGNANANNASNANGVRPDFDTAHEAN